MYTIRKVEKRDAATICEIYNYYVRETVISFESAAVSRSEMEQRIEQISAAYPYLVCEDEGEVVGYAYVNKWKPRCAYDLVAETTIYLRHGEEGRGIGKALMAALIEACRVQGLHSLIGVIALPNEGSTRLHEQLGFAKVGHYKGVGYKFGQHIDVGDWQLIL